jgi:prepilin peptidase CpaA
MLAAPLALTAGYTDWRWRRIPNWLTVPGFLVGIAANSVAGGWAGTKTSLLGAGLGLALLLPFVLVRSLGAGDWKLVGALGAFLGPQRLIAVLFFAVVVAGMMAAVWIMWKRRVGQTLRNMWRILLAFLSFRLPDPELSLDNPEAAKVPFGVAVAIAMVAYTVQQAWSVL